MKETLYFYNSNSKKLTERYEKADVSEVQKLLLQTFGKNSNLLEIGCGSGRDASFMTRNDFNVIAIDSLCKKSDYLIYDRGYSAFEI